MKNAYYTLNGVVWGLCLSGYIAIASGYQGTRINCIDLDFDVASCPDGGKIETPKNFLELPNVCAVEEVTGSRRRYYSECMTYRPRRVCGKPTFIRYHCCTGFEVEENTKGCQGVAPIENLANTAKHLYLKDYRKFFKKNNVINDRLSHGGAYTVFAPENKAFNSIPQETRSKLNFKSPEKNLLSYYMVDGRYYTTDLLNDMNLPTLHKKNATIKINRYSNGVVTANCARIILPNQPSTNGILHVIEKVIEPIDKSVGSVMEKILFDPNLGEFVTALVLTDLANHLRGSSGSYTIFAPTDEAFRNAPKDLINRVLNDNKLVEKLLNYHILDRSICSSAVLGPTTLTTLEGQKLNLSCDILDRLTVNDVPVSDSDNVAYNGVIHNIDTLLIPDSVKTVEDKLNDLGLFEFVEYAQGAGLTDTLKQPGENYTILAPNAAAFSNLTSERKRLLKSSAEVVKRVFNYHVIPGYITTRNMVGENIFDTLGSGNTLNVHSNAKVYSQTFGMNSARIVSKDNAVSNGVVHIIDEVLWPPEDILMDKIQEDPQLQTFISLLKIAGLDEQLLSEGHQYTVFAPTDDAFDAMETSVLESLMLDTHKLKAFLRNHMIHTPTYLRTMENKWRYRYKTMAGDWIDMKRKSNDSPVVVNGDAKVIQSDIHAINGVMHKVDSVFSCTCIDDMMSSVPLF